MNSHFGGPVEFVASPEDPPDTQFEGVTIEGVTISDLFPLPLEYPWPDPGPLVCSVP